MISYIKVLSHFFRIISTTFRDIYRHRMSRDFLRRTISRNICTTYKANWDNWCWRFFWASKLHSAVLNLQSALVYLGVNTYIIHKCSGTTVQNIKHSCSILHILRLDSIYKQEGNVRIYSKYLKVFSVETFGIQTFLNIKKLLSMWN